MSVRVLFDMSVKPERLGDLKAALTAILPDTRVYDGYEDLRVVEDVDDANHVVLIEQWASRQHHEKYIEWRTETGVMGQLAEMVSAPPIVTYLNDTGI